MIANYGFDDGSGSYYISIDTNKCGDCEEKGCIRVCPAGVLISEVNDWDEETAARNCSHASGPVFSGNRTLLVITKNICVAE